ncbi:MAG TPA: DUF1801 domain-containing protein [Candidatus Limnocylindria bacterium]|nr:DUF1801 domain-containing protein [Candidatus Limnocylindria bacterium]
MYEVKTKPQDADVRAYLSRVEPARRRDEGLRLLEVFEQETGAKGVLWGESMVGFGTYRYQPRSGKAAEWFRVGFAPRKAKLVLYLHMLPGREGFLSRLGRHTTGVGCVYANALADLDGGVLREMIRTAWDEMGRLYPT